MTVLTKPIADNKDSTQSRAAGWMLNEPMGMNQRVVAKQIVDGYPDSFPS